MKQFDNLYATLRYSKAYPWYLRIMRPKIFNMYRREKEFYAVLLKEIPGKVFDIGANVGDKTFKFCALGKQVVAVEPDVHNVRLLRKRFAGYPKISVVQAAASNQSGKAMFHVSTPGSPSNTLSGKWKSVLENPRINRWAKKYEFTQAYEVPCLTLDALIESHGVPGYIKIDVEGHELAVLEGLTRPVRLISFEANLPEFRSETIACVQRIMQFTDRPKFNAADDDFTFFWKQPLSGNDMIAWIEQTNKAYFEVFSFTNGL
jgi:FkbM family methyltransferase